jgi:poly(3-hydroxybutyrate) depolymerase
MRTSTSTRRIERAAMALSACIMTALVGCSASRAGHGAGAGGHPGAIDDAPSPVASGTAGSAAATGGAAGSGGAVRSGASGADAAIAAGDGGAGGGGGAGRVAGSDRDAGTADARAGVTTDAAGATGSLPVAPSAGCAKAAPRPAGGTVTVAAQALHMFPASYDGRKPFPLLIALHACNNPNTEFVGLTRGTAFETDYIRTFPNTPDANQCWTNYSADSARVLAQYDELLNTYCIDTNRIVATGHSSGAQLLVNMLAHRTDAQHLKLRGVAPVAADPYNVAVATPVLYIDGMKDNQRSPTSAADTVAKFRLANMCSNTSKAYSAIAGCNSSDAGHPPVHPGCVIYDDCRATTIWCAHDDPAYSGTEHGVPCFAMKAMSDFFATLF